MVYSTRRFVLCLTLCYFILVFFSPFSIASTSLGEERAYLSAFRTFVRFVRVWFCWFPLPLGVWEGLRLVTVALPERFSIFFFFFFFFFFFLQIKKGSILYDRKSKMAATSAILKIYFDFVSSERNLN